MLDELRRSLHELAPISDAYATEFVRRMLQAADQTRASDVHVQPVGGGLDIRFRIDGVLQEVGVFPPGERTHVVTRLKVLARLLTYRHDQPQEGRIPGEDGGLEMRVATFPTLHGERVTVRLFSGGGLRRIEELGFPEDARGELDERLRETSGALLFTGPAGSGKSTSAYACLREFSRQEPSQRAVMTLEDPIEVALEGVVQADVSGNSELSLADGVRSLLRQDPEVVMIGEIRDRETAEAAFNAALTGHLLLTTFHAGSAAGSIERLMDLGIEPYLIRGSVLTIFHQRLLRRLCQCARVSDQEADRLGLPVAVVRQPEGCPKCLGVGYHGRGVLVEWLSPARHGLQRTLLDRGDTQAVRQAAVEAGMIPLQQRAATAVEAGWTSPLEVRRVLGA